jgi:hypothetical protein
MSKFQDTGTIRVAGKHIFDKVEEVKGWKFP